MSTPRWAGTSSAWWCYRWPRGRHGRWPGGIRPGLVDRDRRLIVVVWDLSGSRDEARQRRALRLIGVAFAGLAAYLLVQSTVVLAIGHHPRHSTFGIAWTAVTAGVMFALAAGKARTGQALDNPVLRTEDGSPSLTGCWPGRCCSVWCSTLGLVGGGRTRWPATFWPSTPGVKCGKSSSASTDRPSVPPETPLPAGAIHGESQRSARLSQPELPRATSGSWWKLARGAEAFLQRATGTPCRSTACGRSRAVMSVSSSPSTTSRSAC